MMKAKLYRTKRSAGERELVAQSPVENLWPVLMNDRKDYGPLYPPGKHLLIAFVADRERYTAEFNLEDARELKAELDKFIALAAGIQKEPEAPTIMNTKGERHPLDCQCDACLEEKANQKWQSQ